MKNTTNKAAFRRGIENFCEKTSMHGFAEFYHSRSLIWKSIWAFVVCGAIGITVYQVYQSTWQYIEQSTNTVIGPVDESDMYYPPLQLCYWQWYFWMDFDKVKALNCSKEVLLYSGRFFNSIYSTKLYDLEKAKANFNTMMKNNNFATLLDFYRSVARTVPIFADNNFTAYFDRTQIVYKEPFFLFCYEVSEGNMLKYFSTTTASKVISFNSKDDSQSAVSHFVNENEYNNYILRWADRSSMYKIQNASKVDLTLFAPPISLFLFTNIPKGLEMVSENDEYVVDVRASVFTWRNAGITTCDENKREVSSANTSCQNLCEAQFRKKACTCLRLDHAILLNVTNSDIICYKDAYFFNDTENIVKAIQRTTYACSTTPDLMELWHKCMNECVPACQIWKYEKSVATKTTAAILRQYGTKKLTKIYIEYPSGKDVVIMTVKDAQSWENFVGNVGGLLGVWTGASILSFLQMVYLCCCSNCEECCWPHWVLDKYWQQKSNMFL